MPRDLGARHVIVNVPAFTAALVQDGRVVVRHRTVVGARRTPTPQLTTNAVAVTMRMTMTSVQRRRSAGAAATTRSSGTR